MTFTANEKYVDYLDFSGLSWKRPEGPARVWRVVEGRRETPDGKIPRFSIQEVPKDLEEDVIDFLVTYMFVEEPITSEQGMYSDSLAKREFRTLWKFCVGQGISVVALKLSSDPSEKPVIAGVNIICVMTVEDAEVFEKLRQFRSKSMQKLMAVQLQLLDESNVMAKYGVDKYIAATGLTVHPSLRGQGLGQEILRARDDIGSAYQIPATETIFTATVSQILASRVGFEVLLERKYSELLDDEGKVAFPGVTVEFIKVMAKRLG